MLKQAKLYWLYLANWECRSRSPIRLANRLKEDRVLSGGYSKGFIEHECNFLTARPVFYSWVLLRSDSSNTRKQTKISWNYCSVTSVETKKTKRSTDTQWSYEYKKSYIHWFRTEIHRLKRELTDAKIKNDYHLWLDSLCEYKLKLWILSTAASRSWIKLQSFQELKITKD